MLKEFQHDAWFDALYNDVLAGSIGFISSQNQPRMYAIIKHSRSYSRLTAKAETNGVGVRRRS